MEFSIKAGKLQPAQAAALYVCTHACPCSADHADETVKLLCGGLEEKQSFAEAKTLQNGSLQAVAVLRLQDTARAAVEKAAAEAAKWAQGQPQVEIDLSRLNAAEAALLVEVLTLAIGQAVYRFERFKKEAKPAKLQQVAFYLPQDSAAAEEALRVLQGEALMYRVN